MKKLFTLCFILSIIFTSSVEAQFTQGNLIVVRVGSHTGANDTLLSSGNPVFLDEYSLTGTLVQSIALPTASVGAKHRLILSGTATSEGSISRSPNGQFLALTGYDTLKGGPVSLSSTTSASVNRSVAIINANAQIDITTALNNFCNANNPRSVITTDGNSLWLCGGAGGVVYATKGSTTVSSVSTTVASLKAVTIANGQLYASTSSSTNIRIGAIGTGIPITSGNAYVGLPGVSTTSSPYEFFFADLSAAVPGVDVLYIASADANAITKYSLVSGTWVSNGIVGTVADTYHGITGVVSGTTVTMYATRKNGSTSAGGGELVKIVDASGYNGAFTAAPTLLATAVVNSAFRGVTIVPLTGGVLPLTLVSFTANANGKNVTLNWATQNEVNVDKFIIEKSDDGQSFTGIKSVAALNAVQNSYTVNDLLNSPIAYYRIKSIDKDGNYNYSQVVSVSNVTGNSLTIYPNPAKESIDISYSQTGTEASIKIVSVYGAAMKVYKAQPGTSHLKIDVTALSPGSYIIIYNDQTSQRTARFLKL